MVPMAPVATIAAIDDDPVFLQMLRDVLSSAGYDAHAFPPEPAAVPRLRELRPSATILDIPADRPAAGWAFLNRIRRDPALAARPLIACVPSELTRGDGGDGGDGGGGDGPRPHAPGIATLAKPFDLDALVDLLARLVHD